MLIYLIDTLLSDRLGCYGYEREVSPRIDAFAAEATLFEHVVSQSSWTKASVASIFAGLWPPAHGASLYSESLEVPLIIRLPGQAEAQRVSAPVQQIDVVPTVLEALRIEVPMGVEGRNVLPPLDGFAAVPGARIVTMPTYSHLKLGDSPLFHSLIDGNWKLIRSQDEHGTILELYDWRADRGESENLVEQYPVRAAWMKQEIDHKLAASSGPPPTEEAEIDAEIEEALEALGYLE